MENIALFGKGTPRLATEEEVRSFEDNILRELREELSQLSNDDLLDIILDMRKR